MDANVRCMSDQLLPKGRLPAQNSVTPSVVAPKPAAAQPPAPRGKETGGPSGPEPTRKGDWEHKGRCIDF